MFSPSEQFITQVKFREQRDKSLAAYVTGLPIWAVRPASGLQ